MATATAWIITGIFLFQGEVSVQAHEQAFKTKEACEAFRKQVELKIDEIPTAVMPAYGQQCVEIIVSERKPDLGKGKKTNL